MSSKYQFVAVSAAEWCLEGMQEISGGNLYSHSILNGCWWPWFRVGVKLRKQYFIYLPGKERLSEQVSSCRSWMSSEEKVISHWRPNSSWVAELSPLIF